MMERIRRARENESGFTLIEVLVVISILGVLAGIVVFAVSGITDRGQTNACKTDKATMQTAQQAYYAKTTPGAYAASGAALVTGGLLAADSVWYQTTNSGVVTLSAAGTTAGCT